MKTKFILVILILLFITPLSYAQQSNLTEYGNFSLETSVLTRHWSGNSTYNNQPGLFVLEYHLPNSKLYGLASFENSFYQPSWYLYTGKTYQLYQAHDFKFRWKVTAGIVHGYDDENGKYGGFINQLGTFPAIMPTIGFNYKHVVVDLLPLANEGFLIAAGLRF
jgi:hypothetical protein